MKYKKFDQNAKDLFLSYLKEFGDVRAVCKLIGFTHSTVYSAKQSDLVFSSAWDRIKNRTYVKQVINGFQI